MRRVLIVVVCVFVASIVVRAPTPAEATPAPTDVVFVFDTSGSMEPVLQEAKAEMQEVMTHLQGSIPSVEFGVAEVRDTGEEESGSYAWKLDQPVTSNTTAISEAINPLSAAGGGDSPEAYGRALYETDTNPSVGWRPGARHLIVLIADQVPHMPNVNEGINEAFWVSNPFETGEELEAAAGIADTQWSPGVNIQFNEDLKRLVTDEKPLEMVDYHDTEGDYIHYWEYWAKLGGGGALPANEAGKELATRLIGLVESGTVQCASTATPGEPSPGSNGLPTALTPRFGQAGSRVTVTAPTDTQFCPEDGVRLGGAAVPSFEEASPSKRAFRVPAESSSGLGIAGPSGLLAPAASFEVDNFRYPWGFDIANVAGRGGGETYDGERKIITSEDLESVFHLVSLHFLGLGYHESAAYQEAKEDEESVLGDGLCYGFTMLTWELYLDAHGQDKPLAWANSQGLKLAPGSLPYSQTEAESGFHGLTHALMRGAVSQDSPEVKETWKPVTSAASLEEKVKPAFEKGQPVPVLIFFAGGGHAMLAFNYQQTPGGGVNVDVVDPNVPFGEGGYRRPEAKAYPQLQVKVSADGSWEVAGSFGTTFGNRVSGGPGSLEVVSEPRLPGGLLLPSSSIVAHLWTYIHPSAGDTVGAISYSERPGHGIPSDTQPEQIFDDAPDNRLIVPSSHHTVTATVDSPAGSSAGVKLTGFGYIDDAQLAGGGHTVTVGSQNGSLSVSSAGGGTLLSVTRVLGGIQRTVEARFTGNVRRPSLSVSPTGAVTLTTAGGHGRVSIQLATYMPNGERAQTKPEHLNLRGHTHIHRHTPKVKRHKHKKHKHAGHKPRQKK